eukprot:CAMPEP_0113611662 /NCGR_PEP_ID=MMETSP0017_2-20120614/5680_1 /TAXON_ID=2856 /ORGANISM="Cylindrotheca closterium" /LENGTH=870 /DNA_ID=CAMNT_0000520633 /DNA_START=18 /DNA_END=2627 /DNA_ORIENTATION=+ /assembly_acc=CAM_ASM_000147
MVGENSISCQMLHHGAAASSSSKAVVLIPSTESLSSSPAKESEIVYSSDSILNIARPATIQLSGNDNKETIWNVYETLRTSTKANMTSSNAVSTVTARREITCVSLVHTPKLDGAVNDPTVLLCGFSDGTLTSWLRSSNAWKERILVNDCDKEYGRSITDVGGMLLEDGTSVIAVSCSSGGADYHEFGNNSSSSKFSLVQIPTNVVKFQTLQSKTTLLLIGTAAPRYNKIHIYRSGSQQRPTYCGSLAGHEDWITCFDWSHTTALDYLASGSQDGRIRLWKFEAKHTESPPRVQPDLAGDLSDGESRAEEQDDLEEGESRLEIFHDTRVTSVYLEALLIGHEEPVTSVSWHPCPKSIYGQDLILISSSMDRTILVWGEHESGIWTPISRVGSAGGILGGSVGSSLLGFLNTQIEPVNGTWLLGHGYGGALHIFYPDLSQGESVMDGTLSVEERASLVPWKAMSCVTGHFDGITDLCWEAEFGSYLITVSNDQTCRIWAPSQADCGEAWIEIARPLVHGYGINAVTSLSTSDHRHMLISGSDEKEIRAFDATAGFVKRLDMVSPEDSNEEDSVQRVERAFIPSLGLSNKATAADGAEEDTSMGFSKSGSKLPLERDLGSVSLWPEVGKLYGHTSEVARLTSTLEARSCKVNDSSVHADVLVASSAKARDVETACIRIWDVKENRCLQVLAGGHKSTVVALSFSPDGQYLVSSGKDRRLCLWEKKSQDSQESGSQDLFSLCAAIDSSHKRIVWGAHFCPYKSSTFATCSRDGSVKIWNTCTSDTGNTEIEEVFQFNPTTLSANNKPESVTTVAFAPCQLKGGALLALGLENGLIELWKVPIVEGRGSELLPEFLHSIPPQQCHASTVKKIAW